MRKVLSPLLFQLNQLMNAARFQIHHMAEACRKWQQENWLEKSTWYGFIWINVNVDTLSSNLVQSFFFLIGQKLWSYYVVMYNCTIVQFVQWTRNFIWQSFSLKVDSNLLLIICFFVLLAINFFYECEFEFSIFSAKIPINVVAIHWRLACLRKQCNIFFFRNHYSWIKEKNFHFLQLGKFFF